MQNRTKREITFDTQMKTALKSATKIAQRIGIYKREITREIRVFVGLVFRE